MPCDYTSDNVFKIVIVTIAITLLIVGFIFLVIWLYLCKRNANKLDISYDSHAAQLSIITPNSFNNQKDIHSRFAFDNPYFKDDENDFIVSTQDKLNVNFKNNFSSDATVLTNGNAFTNESDIQNNQINDRSEKNLLQNNLIFKKSWEDGDKNETCEKVSVDLIGHDFTGLGFNICGNMKDGIFVNDVLSRGPANESKKIKAGDKITSLTISMKNMVYEDALTILSYASPYNVTINLEKNEQKSFDNFNKINKNSKKHNLKSSEYQKQNYYKKSMSHPLYKTRSVDNLLQVGDKKNYNYGTSNVKSSQNDVNNQNSNKNNLNKEFFENNKPRNSYERMINKFKQQILNYMNSGNISNELYEQGIPNDETINKKKNASLSPLSTFQKLFKTNVPSWNENLSNYKNQPNDDHNLNAIVVGNNLAFKDDDEDEEFYREFQMSQLKFQQQQQQSAAVRFKNYQQNQNSLNNYSSFSDKNEIDGVNEKYRDQFVTINLENLNQTENFNNKENMKFEEFSSNCKGNSSQLTDLNNSLMSYSSFNSVPLTEAGYNETTEKSVDSINNNNTTTAEIHFTEDQNLAKSTNQNTKLNKTDINEKNLDENQLDESILMKDSKLRSSSMNDLPKEEKTINKEKIIDENKNVFSKNFLERATSLNLEDNSKNLNNLNDESLLVSKTFFNQNLFNDLKIKENFVVNFDKNKKDKTIKLIKTQSSSLKELKEEELKNKEKLSQYSLNYKTIRNSLSTNSTCSNSSSQSSIKLDDEDQDRILIIKPSEKIKTMNEENKNLENKILEKKDLEKNVLTLANQNNLDKNLKNELLSKKIEDKNYGYSTKNKFEENLKTNLNDKRKIFEYSNNLLANDEKPKKIMNDALKMNSIHYLNSIKLEKINNESTKNKYKKKQSNEKLINYNNKKEKLTDSPKDVSNNLKSDEKLINKENKIDNKTNENTIQDNEILNLKNRVSRLKKEFSLKRKEIENQKFNRNRKELNEKKILNKNVIAISKQQQQILNNTSLDFESWSFNENNKN